jgi:hypothetical protein
MENRELGLSQEVYIPSQREINKTRRKFLRIVRHLPQEGQDFLSDMTNVLTEPDIYKDFKSSKERIKGFRDELGQMGISAPKIKIIMNYFNFPYENNDGK